MLNKKFSIKSVHLIRLFIFPLIISIFWAYMIAKKQSIFPTDTYLAYLGWYEKGNASLVSNHYSLDINFVYLPWKYYLAKSDLSKFCLPERYGSFGILTPNQECFPLFSIRHYTMIDPRRLLEKYLPFFVGYDLGYLINMILIWISCFFFLLSCRYPYYISSLGAALSLSTFWISKELQYDQYSGCIPFLYLALTSITLHKTAWKKYILFSVFIFFSLLFTSLQGFINLGILIIISLIILKQIKFSQFRWSIALSGLSLIYFLIFIITFSSFTIFSSNSVNYIQGNSLIQELLFSLKRCLIPLIDLLTLLTSGIFANFDTIDPWKILGDVGGREYLSSDTLNCYATIAFVIILGFAIAGTRKNQPLWVHKKIITVFALSFLIPAVLCVSPLYKFVYFRLIQTVFSFHAPLLFCLAWMEFEKSRWLDCRFRLKKLIISFSVYFLFIFMIGLLLATPMIKETILSRLAGGGTLGFEPGFWISRYERLNKRMLFMDIYSASFILISVIIISTLYFYKRSEKLKPLNRRLIKSLCVVILQACIFCDAVAHTWSFNSFQPVNETLIFDNSFWKMNGIHYADIESKPNVEGSPPIPPPNFLINYGIQPPYFYESLSLPRVSLND